MFCMCGAEWMVVVVVISSVVAQCAGMRKRKRKRKGRGARTVRAWVAASYQIAAYSQYYGAIK